MQLCTINLFFYHKTTLYYNLGRKATMYYKIFLKSNFFADKAIFYHKLAFRVKIAFQYNNKKRAHVRSSFEKQLCTINLLYYHKHEKM